MRADRDGNGNRCRKAVCCAAAVLLALLLCACGAAAEAPPEAAPSEAATQEQLQLAALTQQLAQVQGSFVPQPDDLRMLEELAAQDVQLQPYLRLFLSHIDAYSQRAVDNVLVSPEKILFVLTEPFPQLHPSDRTPVTVQPGEIPLLLQYDARWGYRSYGSSCIGYTGCGPACLSMAIVGLTGDGSATPDVIAAFAERAGYYVPGAGTDWQLLTEGAAAYGLHSWMIDTKEARMRDCLQRGGVLIASVRPGEFTRVGHFIVLYDCGMQGFSIHDPNSAARSSRLWQFEELAGEIVQLWCLAA